MILTVYGLIQELTKQILVLLNVLMLILGIMYRLGLIRRGLQRIAERLLSKEINGAHVTMADLQINILSSEIEVTDLIIHNSQRAEWQWDSPVFVRVGKIKCRLNILSCIDPISAMLQYPCKDIYGVRIEDVQIFVEKRGNVFNFHLFDGSLEIPDPHSIMCSPEKEPVSSTSAQSITEKVFVIEDNGTGGLEASYDLETSGDASVEKKKQMIL